MRNRCLECGHQAPEEIDFDPDNLPTCATCGGRLRPDVVWFGEMLNAETIEAAFNAAEQADLFFSIGTSAIVHPAASLPVAAKRSGATLVEINPERTPLSDMADFCFQSPSGELLPRLLGALRELPPK